ncbi:hypothetical protein GN958_ATG15070 [Phytophthora infestans]|uniref:Uncharacterized protein n=1 Tax=Phytophthora infestans TaxID=4787 RepID=A0A8S9U4A2_PHYIN|nr:hypothetical protein GN958_ATG15070 [Phytophthora infestans]
MTESRFNCGIQSRTVMLPRLDAFPSANVNETLDASNVEPFDWSSRMKSLRILLRELPLFTKAWYCSLPCSNLIITRIGIGNGLAGAWMPTNMYSSSLEPCVRCSTRVR